MSEATTSPVNATAARPATGHSIGGGASRLAPWLRRVAGATCLARHAFRSLGVVTVALAATSSETVGGRAAVSRGGQATPSPGFTATSLLSTIAFEPNLGQFDPTVRFAARTPGFMCLLTDSGLVLERPEQRSAPEPGGRPGYARTLGEGEAASPGSVPVGLAFAGARQHPKLTGQGLLPGKINVFHGLDPSRWITNIPTYSEVRFHEVYPGIDVLFHARNQHLEFDFLLAPGADPAAIRLAPSGATSLSIAGGALVLASDAGTLRLTLPATLEATSDGRRGLTGGFVLRDRGEIGFTVHGHDASHSLTIDPVLEYSTYLGNTRGTQVSAITADDAGNAYVAGWASLSQQIFVSKIAPDGTVVFLTYLGGVTLGRATGIALDPQGSIYVTGWTSSPDFPTTRGVFQPTHNTHACGTGAPCEDAFITKISADGSTLIYSTFLGGDLPDYAEAIAVDAAGNAVITGETASRNFPLVNPFQATYGGGESDVFVTRLNASATQLTFSTYLGGADYEYAQTVSYDSAGNVLVAGSAASVDFPVRNPRPLPPGADRHKGFLARFAADGAALFSTLFGGSGPDSVAALATDGRGHAYLCGATRSPDFPVVGGIPGATGIGFVSKLSVDSLTLLYSTRFGSPGGATALAIDPSGAAVVGVATTLNGAALIDPLQSTIHGWANAFLAELQPDGAALLFSTYLGSTSSDSLAGLAVDGSGTIHLAGSTDCGFPLINAARTECTGAYVAAISLAANAAFAVGSRANPDTGWAPLTTTFAATTTSGTPPFTFNWDFGDGSPHSALQNPSHTYASPGSYVAQLAVHDANGAAARASVIVGVTQRPPCTLSCTASAPLLARTLVPVVFQASATASEGCGGPPTYLWSFDDGTTDTSQSPTHTFGQAGVYSWSLTVTTDGQTCAKQGTITVRDGAPRGVYLVPAVAHNPGYYGTQWRTDLSLVNTDLPPFGHATFVYLSGADPLVRTVDLSGGAVLEWQDVLTSLFGLAPDASSSGTLQVFSDEPLVLTARTYDRTEQGTLGASYPALSPGDGFTGGQRLVIPSVKKNDRFRTNVGAINLGESECSVSFTLADTQGFLRGDKVITLPAGRWQQVNDIFAAVGSPGADLAYVIVTSGPATCRLWAYGSVIDNGTGDPTTIPAVLSP